MMYVFYSWNILNEKIVSILFFVNSSNKTKSHKKGIL